MTKPACGIFFSLCLSVMPIPEAKAQLFGKKKEPDQRKLAPGEFEWYPERAGSGPLLIVVSIDDQLAYVYRNGVQIARSTVSTGAPGHDTPTGVFTILQKNKDHESTIYKGAKMPNMQRLTWSGIAMHAGQLPGYPASHGCVRLPTDFSSKLFTITETGGTVVVTKRAAKPASSEKPASILLASNVTTDSRPNPQLVGKTIWEPKRSPSGPVNFLLSGKDRTIYVYRNGILIGQSPVGILNPEIPIPAGVFLMLEGVDPNNVPVVSGRPARPWTTLALDELDIGQGVEDLRRRLQIPKDFGRIIYDLAKPGTILLTTAFGSTPETQTKTDFTIMRPEGS
ncbi:MAG TPA: L,D-transpeptidase [Verrucomicrobiales bacterium]|nr:L,D-transpeptidase [Verrucomicrobiales bacterium]